MKKWKCLVCGYIHTGDEPPDKCPVCGADRSKFEEVIEESAVKAEITAEKSKPKNYYHTLTALMTKHHIHPISVHIPNGVLPISVVFIFLSIIFKIEVLRTAALCNLIFVVLAMPVVLFSGYNDWKQRYNGSRTDIFFGKIICGFLVFLTALISLLWQLVDPSVAMRSSGWATFLILNIIMVGAAGAAGFLGGKLVFDK